MKHRMVDIGELTKSDIEKLNEWEIVCKQVNRDDAFEAIMIYDGYSLGCIYEIKALIKRVYGITL